MAYSFVSFIGLIGSGKTTAARLFAKEGFELFEEDYGNNSFLPKYYKRMKRWAFHSQMFFLVNKIKNHERMETELLRHHVSQDFPLYQDVAFAKTCYELGNMSPAEWSLYYDTFLYLNRNVRQPDFMIYLNVSTETALERIKIRGRDYELGIEGAYLDSLRQSIEAMIESHVPPSRLITINADDIDLVHNSRDISTFVSKVKKTIEMK